MAKKIKLNGFKLTTNTPQINIPQKYQYHTTAPVEAEQIKNAADSVEYLRLIQNMPIAQSVILPPDTTVNPMCDGSPYGYYYIVSHLPDREDNRDRKMRGFLMGWPNPDAVNADNLDLWWYPDYAPGTPGTGINVVDATSDEDEDGDWDYGRRHGGGNSYTSLFSMDFDPDDNGWHVGRLRINGCFLHSFSAWSLGAPLKRDRSDRVMSAEYCRPGDPIIGYDDSNTKDNVGKVVNNIVPNDSDRSIDSAERVLSPMLHQTMHPFGWWYEGDSNWMMWRNIIHNNHSFRLLPRFLDGISSYNYKGLPFCVIQGDADCMIMAIADNGTFASYTITGGGISNPTLIEPDDFNYYGEDYGIRLNATGFTDLRWAVFAPNGDEITVHTIGVTQG